MGLMPIRFRAVVAMCALFGMCNVAHAQTTVDSFDPGANDSVRAVAVQPDGKVLVGGSFTRVGGGGFGNTTRNRIARLNADGSVDTAFNPGANNDVIAFAIQPDGKIVIGGIFTAVGGGTGTTTRNRIARLNADGSLDTGFNPGANSAVQALALQSDGKIVIAGSFTMLGGGGTGTTTRNYIGRLNADGSLDTAFNPGADDFITALAIQSNGGILVGGSFFKLGNGGTTSRTFFGRINPDGSLDNAFDPDPNSSVYAIVIQSDTQIVFGGGFTFLGPLATGSTRRYIARVNASGGIDPTFNPGTDGNVYAIALQPDGKFVVGGSFTKVGGGGTGPGTTSRLDLARINADGTVDAGFDPGANSIGGVVRVVLQSDGKILVSGDFTQLGGGGSGTSARNGIGRINSGVPPAGPAPTITSVSPSGGWGGGGTSITITGTNFQGGALVSLGGVNATSVVVASATTITATTPPHAGGAVDVVVANPDLQSATKAGAFTYAPTTDADGFNPGASGAVKALTIQADGKILVGGAFSSLGGGGTGTTTRGNIGRLNADGTIDAGFLPGASSQVEAIVVQPDGRVLVGGSFTMLGGGGPTNNGTIARSRIGRLNADGTLDDAFNPGANGSIHVIALQADGKILVGGEFTTLTGVSRNRIGRLNADGTLDTTFDPGSSTSVWYLTVQPDGKVLVGSTYSFANPSASIRRLNADGSTDTSFTPPVPSSGGGPFAVLAGGKILAGGIYATTDNSASSRGLARLNANGTLDTTFKTDTDGYFNAILPQPDGRILVGGLFLRIGADVVATPRSNIALLSANGALDTSFDVGANGEVYELVLQADGKIIAGGSFTKMGGGGNGVTVRNNLARFSLPAPPPTMTLDRTSLQFSAVSTGAAFTSQTGTQAVRLTQSGTGTVSWTASSSVPWLVVFPESGTGSATLTLSVRFAPFLAATQAGNVTLSFTGAANTAGPIAVTLTTVTGSTAARPVGAFETPVDNITGVSGSIAVTGWAVDDVEVTRVRLLRDPVGSETPGQQIFIGNAVFVEGARPDVAQTFPSVPRSTRAGWGYLLLTNFLPNQGNGAFKLYAYADDVDGHSTLLGTKTITCDNLGATRPFGAIDTPAQGESVSGSVNNFGWVLARGALRADPPSGGTVIVLVDGVNVGAPGSWGNRSDLSALFPVAQYSGVNNALGVFGLDTTTLANGVHTIAWIVTDNQGGADGVGSRYFTISNGSAVMADPGNAALQAGPMGDAAVDLGHPAVSMSIPGRRGYDLDAPLKSFRSDQSGRIMIDGEELDRFELHLGARAVGYLEAGAERWPLPIGSHLDPSTGVFTWQPGVAFVGPYDFVFVRSDGGTPTRIAVRIVLHPKGRARSTTLVAIDTPAASEGPVAQPFVVAGWAADPEAPAGAGITTVHVWAYPTDGRAPIFLGAAAYGGSRPDVAALYGHEALASGYGLTVEGLEPGTYDLAVFAWSTATGGFVPAKVVRVVVR